MIAKYECVIVANGLFPSGDLALQLLEKAVCVIACDGAVVQLERLRIPDVVVGDLDSLPAEWCQRYKSRLYRLSEQETNDLTKAVHYARRQGFREVLILGATGLREDHTLGNISLLATYSADFDRIEMLSDYGIFTPISSTTTFDSEPGQQVSLFSLSPHEPISVSGLRYPIENRRLLSWWEATLNEALSTTFTVIIPRKAHILVYRAFK